MRQKWSNNASTILSIDITSDTTNITVDNNDGFTSLEENEFEILTISNGTVIEIIKVTARNTVNWVIERGQEGTMALNWTAGSPIQARVTAGSLERFSQIEFDPQNIPDILVSSVDPIRAIGPGSTVLIGDGFSSGDNCSSTNGGIAVGIQSSSIAVGSTSIGKSSLSSGENSLSIGKNNTSSVTNSISCGNSNVASGMSSLAIGNGNNASGVNSVSVGKSSNSSGGASIAIGFECSSSGEDSSAIGVICESNGDSSIAIGIETTSNGRESIAIGNLSDSVGIGSIAIGKNSKTKGDYQLNFTAIPASQPPSELDTRDPSLFLSTQPTVFFTPIIDLKVPEYSYTMSLPNGIVFYVDEIGFIGKHINTITVKPVVNIGSTTIPMLFHSSKEITTVSNGSRFIFTDITGTHQGVNSFKITTIVNAGALEYTGQFYIKGFAVAT